jgi:hypothetical protein
VSDSPDCCANYGHRLSEYASQLVLSILNICYNTMVADQPSDLKALVDLQLLSACHNCSHLMNRSIRKITTQGIHEHVCLDELFYLQRIVCWANLKERQVLASS